MKSISLIFIINFFFVANLFASNIKDSCINVSVPAIWDTVLLGDINNDKIADTAFIFTPETIECHNSQGEIQLTLGCEKDICYNKIKFSCKLPEIYFDNSVWGRIEKIDDIDNDGVNELIFSPGWFTSCWGRLYIYSYKNGNWVKICENSFRRCEGESLKSHVVNKNNKYYLNGVIFKAGDDVKNSVTINLRPKIKK